MKRAAEISSVGPRIRSRREELRLSMRQLAARSGLAVSFISKIESGKASPTIMSLQRVLEAMDVDLADFFRDGAGRDLSDQIVYPRAAMRVLEGQGRKWWFAFPSHPSVKAVLTYEEYAPRTRILERESHRGDVCGFVIDGEFTLEVLGRGVFRIRKGDAFYVKAREEHIARNEGRRTLRMAVIQLKDGP